MKRIITTYIALLMTAIIFGQSPERMSYQAVIRNSSNALITTAPVGMRISILQGSVSGTEVYIETQIPSTNANGLVSIEIGGGSVVSGVFSTINWANGPYFIKTETDADGGTNYTITGISQLLSVPYALYAAKSGSSTPGPQGPKGDTGIAGPQGAAGTNGIDGADGAQGSIGLTGVTGSQGIQGDVGPQGPIGLTGADGAVGAQGPKGDTGLTGLQGETGLLSSGNTAGNTPYWNGSQWFVNNNNIFNAGANVGIGTNNPSSKLEVIGNIKTDSFRMTTGAAAGKVLTSDANGNGSWQSPGSNVAFKASKRTQQSFPVGISSTSIVIFSDEKFDYGNNYDPVTSTFTAPSAGLYHFDITLSSFLISDGSGNTGSGFYNLYVNNTTYDFGITFNSKGRNNHSFSGILKLNANDVVSVISRFSSGGTISSDAGYEYCFMGYKIF